MLFQIISDLHLEYYDDMPKLNYFFIKTAPNLILAGDICFYRHPNFIKFFKIVSKIYDNIFYVPGNHEYYTKNNYPDIALNVIDFIIKESLEPFENVYFIQNSYIELDDTIILGNTLWFRTHRNNKSKGVKLLTNSHYIIYENKYMPSYTEIKNANNNQYKWLKNQIIDLNTTKKIIVVTHYLPSIKCINKKYENDKYNDLYYTDCQELFYNVDYWICGHSHCPFDKMINNTHIILNPRGTPDENTNYSKTLVINTSKSNL